MGRCRQNIGNGYHGGVRFRMPLHFFLGKTFDLATRLDYRGYMVKSEIKEMATVAANLFEKNSEKICLVHRFPFAGFTVEAVEALKRLHPDLSSLSKGIDCNIVFKNGSPAPAWLSDSEKDVSNNAERDLVRSTLSVMGKCLGFRWTNTENGKIQGWRGTIRLRIDNFDIAPTFALAHGIIDHRKLTDASWKYFQVRQDGVILPVPSPGGTL